MTAMTNEATAGKRRAAHFGDDFPDVARPMTEPSPGYSTPTLEARNAGPIAEALGYAVDRLDLVDHKLGELNATIERLGYELRAVLADDGDRPEPAPPGPRAEDPEVMDRRSTVARRIAATGHRADDVAGRVDYLRFKLEGILGALELEGVAR